MFWPGCIKVKAVTRLSSSLSSGGWNPAGGGKPLPLLPQLVSSGAYRWRGSSQHHSAGLLPLLHPSAAAGQCHACGHTVAPHAPAQQPAGPAGHRQQVAEQVRYSEDCGVKAFLTTAGFMTVDTRRRRKPPVSSLVFQLRLNNTLPYYSSLNASFSW